MSQLQLSESLNFAHFLAITRSRKWTKKIINAWHKPFQAATSARPGEPCSRHQKDLTFVLSALLLLLPLATQAAPDKEELVVYTYDSFVSDWGPGPKLEALFEKDCQCDLNFVAVEDGVSILNRLRIEQKTSKADVILGIDNGLMIETRRLGIVQPHEVTLENLNPSLQWQDPHFVPFDFGYFAFVYDKNRVTNPVDSFEALVNSDASVIYQDPRTSTPGQGLLMWVKKIYGDASDEFWEDIGPRTVTVTKGWWEAYSMFLEGASDYVLSYHTSPAYHMVAEEKDHIRAAQFKEGHLLQIEVAAMTTFTKKPKLARAFLEFLISKPAQEVIPVTNWMLPARKQASVPDAFEQLIRPEPLSFSPQEIAENRQQWIREWRSVVTR